MSEEPLARLRALDVRRAPAAREERELADDGARPLTNNSAGSFANVCADSLADISAPARADSIAVLLCTNPFSERL